MRLQFPLNSQLALQGRSMLVRDTNCVRCRVLCVQASFVKSKPIVEHAVCCVLCCAVPHQADFVKSINVLTMLCCMLCCVPCAIPVTGRLCEEQPRQCAALRAIWHSRYI